MLFCRRNGRRISTSRRYVMGGRFANLWFMNSVICMYILAMPRQKEGAKSENRTNLFFFSEMWKLRESWVDSRCGIWEREEEHEGKWWRREYELYFSSLLMGLKIQCLHSISWKTCNGGGKQWKKGWIVMERQERQKNVCGEVFLAFMAKIMVIMPHLHNRILNWKKWKKEKETSFVQLDCNLSSLLPCKVFKTNIQKIELLILLSNIWLSHF